MTASERYFVALTSYGNELFAKQEYCDAYDVYLTASSVGVLDGTSANNSAKAYAQCNPATEAPPTATTETAPATTEPPVATEVPTTQPAP
jgi:hypothetical protein